MEWKACPHCGGSVDVSQTEKAATVYCPRCHNGIKLYGSLQELNIVWNVRFDEMQAENSDVKANVNATKKLKIVVE